MYELRLFRSKNARLAAAIGVTAQINGPIRETSQRANGSTESFAIGRSLRRVRRPESSSLTKREIAAKHLISGVLERFSHSNQQRRFAVGARSMRQHQRPGGVFDLMQESGCLTVAKWSASGTEVHARLASAHRGLDSLGAERRLPQPHTDRVEHGVANDGGGRAGGRLAGAGRRILGRIVHQHNIDAVRDLLEA